MEPVFAGPAKRTIATMFRTLTDRGDPALMFDAEIAVELPGEPKEPVPASRTTCAQKDFGHL